VALALVLGAEQAVKDIVQSLAATPQGAAGTDGQRIAETVDSRVPRPVGGSMLPAPAPRSPCSTG
jgi:hypothetical protein